LTLRQALDYIKSRFGANDKTLEWFKTYMTKFDMEGWRNSTDAIALRYSGWSNSTKQAIRLLKATYPNEKEEISDFKKYINENPTKGLVC